MDEIDAALDFKNVSIIAHYIKERTKNAQFIIISLRNNMFELADRLFGIYKVNNCTSATYINPEICELDEKLRKNQNKTNLRLTQAVAGTQEQHQQLQTIASTQD
jgi:ABC-type transport system involved in cytochrome bd biosynthesis fused ATPase/permease subunit